MKDGGFPDFPPFARGEFLVLSGVPIHPLTYSPIHLFTRRSPVHLRLFFFVPLFPAAEYQLDWCLVQTEAVPEPVDQKPFVRKVDAGWVVAKQDEHRRAGPGLCSVKKLEPSATNHWRFMGADSFLERPVEDAG